MAGLDNASDKTEIKSSENQSIPEQITRVSGMEVCSFTYWLCRPHVA